MSGMNGRGDDQTQAVVEEQLAELGKLPPKEPEDTRKAEPTTRTKLRARQHVQQNRFVIVAAGAVVFALLIFAVVSAPRKGSPQKPASTATASHDGSSQAPVANEKSLLPITDSGRAPAKEAHAGFLNEQDLERSATKKTPSRTSTQPSQSENASGSLGSIPPFGEQPWQAPPYQPGIAPNGLESREQGKSEREAFEKASLVFVRNASATEPAFERRESPSPIDALSGLGLPTGTRLRARLESATSTAVRTPVLAVIEYNYERDGEIVVPAGAKAVGQIQEADRSGYIRIQFDSLLLPDGARVPIQAAATDLQMRPVKGKVEGKNTGKNVLVRSLSGIGQASTMLLGRGSLNQPLSESDLMRERISNNIGQASDEEISRLSVTSRVVVSVSAGTQIYVVLEQSSKSLSALQPSVSKAQGADPESLDQLRQLLQLQRELNQTGTKYQ